MVNLNTRNYSHKTNYTCGSKALDLLPFYVQSTVIPGLSFSLPEVSGRGGARLTVSSDSVAFNTLSLEILLDEDYKIYEEITNIIFDHININTGTFANFSFDFWTEVTDDMGRTIMKVEYHNCKIETLGDLPLDSTDDGTETVFTLDLRYDYYDIIFSQDIPTLRG